MSRDDRPDAFGDMAPETFRRHGHELVDWIARYLSEPERYPVLSRVEPNAIRDALQAEPPRDGAPFDEIFSEFERVVLPGITHWNHPGFFAYFAISGSGPGVLADLLAAALNVQAMLWRTSPAATELEEVALGWLRQLLGLPPVFEGVIYDTASIATLHALAAARDDALPGVRERGLAGRPDVGPVRVYASDQAHMSVDKAVMTLGLGHEALYRIPVDDDLRMRVDALGDAITGDRAAGRTPVAVVATVGTTSTTSLDPVPAVADICEREGLWLHVDAAYAGAAALVPETHHVMDGCDRADSVVVNPHKWLFTPFDLSAFYCRRMDVVRRAFALTPDYLETPERGRVRNLMDTGVQLGRRFRALKLWMVLRHFGADGLRDRIAEHIRLARVFAGWVDASDDFERMAPVPLSVVCFRAKPRLDDDAQSASRGVPAGVRGAAPSEDDQLNLRLLDAVNASGDVFLSHTKIGGRVALRMAIGNIRTTERHVARAWELLQERLAEM